MESGLPRLSLLCCGPQLGHLLQIYLRSPRVPQVIMGRVAGMPSPEFELELAS